MSTKDLPGPFDGMERARPGEPVFTLRAHDALASVLVHEWVSRRRKIIREAAERGELTEAKRELELIQCREAEELAWSMEAWRKGEIAERVEELEEPAAKPAAYSGHASSEEEIAARDRYNRVLGAVRLLDNANAALVEAANDYMADLGLYAEGGAVLAYAERVKAISAHIAPKRASYHAGEAAPEPFPDVRAIVKARDLRWHLSGSGEQ